jgi:hypothetical protein
LREWQLLCAIIAQQLSARCVMVAMVAMVPVPRGAWGTTTLGQSPAASSALQ